MKIELTPHNALAILSLLREFVNEDNRDDPKFKAIHEAVDQLEREVIDQIMPEEIEEAFQEAAIRSLMGEAPPVGK